MQSPASLSSLTVSLAGLLLLVPALRGAPEEKPVPPPPLQGLLVTGGCSHDYIARAEILTHGLRERLSRRIEWKVQRQGEGESDVRIPFFESSQWATGYDFVVHDYCFPRVDDPDYIARIIAPHEAGLPAVLLHGTLISFQTGDEGWARFCGATIRSHEREGEVTVEPLDGAADLLKDFKAWAIPREELYRIEREWPGIRTLNRGVSKTGVSFPTTWTNRAGTGQVFATTLGNATATLRDPRYLDLVARGLIWSLGDEAATDFVKVSPEESLKGVAVREAPIAPLLRLGRNAALGGETTGFFWSGEGRGTPANVVDGDPATTWTSSGPGPGAWELRFGGPQSIGAVAVFWDGPPPAESKLETLSSDGLWVEVSAEIPQSNPLVLSFAPRETSGLRLSISRTDHGKGFGITEVGAYESLGKVPSAIIAAATVPPHWPSEPVAKPDEVPALVRDHHLALVGRIECVVPTASGTIFLTHFPESGDGSVMRVNPNGEILPFLKGIAPGTSIAWDGEWLHTLLGRRLDRVRCALGDGPADERGNGAWLFDWVDPSGKPEPVISKVRLEGDGWFYGIFEHPEGGKIRNSGGEVSRLPKRGVVRFRGDGSGFDVCLPVPSRVVDFEVEPTGRIRIFDEAPIPTAPDFAGFSLRVRDGQDLHLLGKDGEGWRWRHLLHSQDEAPMVTDWNQLDVSALLEVLRKATRPSTRGEAVGEILRRKQDPFVRLTSDIANETDSAKVASMVAALAGRKSRNSLAWLATTAEHAEGAARPPAFLALGDLRGFASPHAFEAIGTVTEPGLSAAILEGLRRSREDLPGIEKVALEMTVHPDPDLAESAVRFLVSREAFAPALAVVIDSAREEAWRGAAEVLASVSTLEQLNSIVAAARDTRDPAVRMRLLRIVCRLHDSFPVECQSVLVAALKNPRVDARELLSEMVASGLPLPGLDVLWPLRNRNPGLETFLVKRLVETSEPVLPNHLPYLREISSDPDRDEELRVAALLASFRREPAPDFREQFVAIAAVLETMRGAPVPDAVRAWAADANAASDLNWISERTRQKKSGTIALADLLRPGSAPSDDEKPSAGREIFRAERCGACHNIHGEGPSSAPDLAIVVGTLSDEDLRTAILAPGTTVAPGYEMTIFQGKGGVLWQGRVDQEEAVASVLLDRAGNRFELPEDSLVQVSGAGPSTSACGSLSPLEPARMAALIAFLRSLGGR